MGGRGSKEAAADEARAAALLPPPGIGGGGPCVPASRAELQLLVAAAFAGLPLRPPAPTPTAATLRAVHHNSTGGGSDRWHECVRLVVGYAAPVPPVWVVVGGQVRYGTETTCVELFDFAQHLARPRRHGGSNSRAMAACASAASGWVRGPDTLFGHGARPAVAVLPPLRAAGDADGPTRLFVCGGSIHPQHSSIVECLELPSAVPPAVDRSGSVAALLASAGASASASASASAPDAPHWMRCADLCVGRRGAGAAVVHGRLCVFGGATTPAPAPTAEPDAAAASAAGAAASSAPAAAVAAERMVGSMEVYDEHDNAWHLLPSSVSDLRTPRALFACVTALGGRVVAIGGVTNAPPASAHTAAATGDDTAAGAGAGAGAERKWLAEDVEVFDPITRRWSVLNTLPDGGRYLCSADVMDGGRMLVVVGGCGPRPGATASTLLWCRPWDPPTGRGAAGAAAAAAWHEVRHSKVELYHHTSAVVGGHSDWTAAAASTLFGADDDVPSSSAGSGSGLSSDPTAHSTSSNTTSSSSSGGFDAHPFTVFTAGGASRLTAPDPVAAAAAQAARDADLQAADQPDDDDLARTQPEGATTEQKQLAAALRESRAMARAAAIQRARDAAAAAAAAAKATAVPPFSRSVSYRLDLPRPWLLANAAAAAASAGVPDTAVQSLLAGGGGGVDGLQQSLAARACRVCVGGGSSSAVPPPPNLADPKLAGKITVYSQNLPHLLNGRWGHASLLIDQF